MSEANYFHVLKTFNRRSGFYLDEVRPRASPILFDAANRTLSGGELFDSNVALPVLPGFCIAWILQYPFSYKRIFLQNR